MCMKVVKARICTVTVAFSSEKVSPTKRYYVMLHGHEQARCFIRFITKMKLINLFIYEDGLLSKYSC